jgi:hypothetical protein
MAEKKVTRKPASKPKDTSSPTLKGAAPVSQKPKVTSIRKPSAPKPVVFNIIKGGGIWYKLPQNNTIVFDEEKGYNREIRYCPAERSIYKDEQSDTARREQIVFRDGMLTVDYTNPMLIFYLRAHPDNIENGGKRFNEVNDEFDAEKELEIEFILHDAISKIKTSAIDELIPVALSYGISADLSSLEIKRALLQQAKGNPETFMQAFDNPMVKLRASVITAVDFQILKQTADGMYWYDSNALIMPTPLGKDTLDVFVRFLMTDTGNPVRDEVERQLETL